MLSAWGDLKSSCHRYLSGGRTMFLVSKRLCKIKYGFEGSTSKVDLSFVLTKQPFNVYFFDIMVQLNHLNNITKNSHMFVGIYVSEHEITVSFIVNM